MSYTFVVQDRDKGDVVAVKRPSPLVEPFGFLENLREQVAAYSVITVWHSGNKVYTVIA